MQTKTGRKIIYFILFATLGACGEVKDPNEEIDNAIDRQYEGNFKMVCLGTFDSKLNTAVHDVTFSYELSRIVGAKYISEAHVRRKSDDLKFNLGIGASTKESVTLEVLGEDGKYLFEADKEAVKLSITHQDSDEEPKAKARTYPCEKTFSKDK